MSHLMSNNIYFSKTYILNVIIALLASPTPDSKIDIFAWLSNI